MKTALVAIASPLERPYLTEWLSHHLFTIGFDSAYLYLNDWDKIDLDVTPFWQAGKKAYIFPIEGACKQLDAYNSFIELFSGEYDWAAFLDVDEFLHVYSGNLNGVLQYYRMFPALAVNWRLFGSNGIEKAYGDYSVRRFARCAKSLNQHVKQVLNVKFCRDNGIGVSMRNPHFANVRWANQENMAGFGPFNRMNLDFVHNLEIWHYAVKSREEFLLRRSYRRADCGTPRENIESFWKEHDLNEIECETLNFCK